MKRYWFQIRKVTNLHRGYFVNVGVGIYDDATGTVMTKLADDAPEQAHALVKRLTNAVQQAAHNELAYVSSGTPRPKVSPLDALMRAMGDHPSASVQPGPLLGMTTRAPIAKLLADTYQDQVA